MKKFIIFALLACVLAVSAFAAKVDFTIEDSATIKDLYWCEYDNAYAIAGVVNATGGNFTGCDIVVKYDPTIFQAIEYPLDAYAAMNDVDILANVDKAVYGPITSATTGRFGPVYEYASKAELTSSEVDGKVRIVATYYDTATYPAATDLVLFKLFFRYADGKSAADIKSDSFEVEYIRYTDKTLGGYTYGTRPTGTTLAGPALEVAVDFLPDPVIIDEDDIAIDNIFRGIRKDTAAAGIRFRATFATAIKEIVSEYGYLVTVESEKNALPAGYELDMALVDAGKAVKAPAFIPGELNKFANEADGITEVFAVVTGVPASKVAYETPIAVRTYCVVDGVAYYSATTTDTVAAVAQTIKDANDETYAKYAEYVDGILDVVNG